MEANRIDRFFFKPAIRISKAAMPLNHTNDYVIRPPVYIAQTEKNATNIYPVVAMMDEYTLVDLKLVNQSQKIYGKGGILEATDQNGKSYSGSRRVRVEISYLPAEGQTNYLESEFFAAYVKLDGKKVAETQSLLTEPMVFEVDKIESLSQLDLKAGFDIYQDKNVKLKSKFNAIVKVFISSLPGEEPNKLVWSEDLHFIYTLDHRFTRNHKLVIFNKQVQCYFPNVGFKKWRILDRMYITKSFEKDTKNAKEHRVWYIKLATGWTFMGRSPVLDFEINDFGDFYNSFMNPKGNLYSDEMVDFLNKGYVPKAKQELGAGHKFQIDECVVIPDRTLGPLNVEFLYREVLPRDWFWWQGYVMMSGQKGIFDD